LETEAHLLKHLLGVECRWLVLALPIGSAVKMVQVEQALVVEVSVVEAIVVESIVEGVGYGRLIGSPVVD
jgi:uncharacterized membrane protein